MSSNRTIALIYSETDDAMIEGGIKGWVSNFHKILSTLMYQITRENPEIKLITEANFSEKELDDYNVILTVLTSNFVKNTKIVNALNSHCKNLKSNSIFIDI